MQNREGHRIPDVVLHTRTGHQWVDLRTDELFAGRTVILFALPGAFTPTCSSTHVPRYNQLAPVFKRHGVDEIFCLSVNDPFVMNAWQTDQQAHNLRFLADGNGEFSAAMGMLVDKSELGFGKRSWRYSMLVKDGVIEKMFIEPEVPGDPFEVSDADTMLAYLAPGSEKPKDVTLLARHDCEYCARARQMLTEAGIAFEELVLNRDITEAALRALSGRRTVPQVFINGEHIGDSDALRHYLASEAAA